MKYARKVHDLKSELERNAALLRTLRDDATRKAVGEVTEAARRFSRRAS
jgi:hypothetical protein